MPTTIAEIALSAAYRDAQRALAAWLERGGSAARHRAFSARAAVTRLNLVERHQLARWLAWLCLAARSHGESILGRIQRLDTSLGSATADALSHLPATTVQWPAPKAIFERIVSADTAPHMTSVGSPR